MKKKKTIKLNLAFILAGIFFIGFLGVSAILAYTKFSSPKTISTSKAQEMITEFFSLAGYTGVTVSEVKDEDPWVYTVTVESQGQEFSSYITKDGLKFFQSAFDMDLDKLKEDQAAAEAEQASMDPANVAKSDKPVVELFVMSHCPYGTQMEKGIIPVVEALGDKIDFQLKFCNYAMHGETELEEQLLQYCIMQKQSDKFLPYLKCFLEDGDTERCSGAVGLNRGPIDECVNQTDEQYGVSAGFADQSTWLGGNYPLFNVYAEDNTKYNVGGSPTLVINGQQISSQRDPASILQTICYAFNQAPEECNNELSVESPAPGFGTDTTTTDTTDAGCGT